MINLASLINNNGAGPSAGAFLGKMPILGTIQNEQKMTENNNSNERAPSFGAALGL